MQKKHTKSHRMFMITNVRLTIPYWVASPPSSPWRHLSCRPIVGVCRSRCQNLCASASGHWVPRISAVRRTAAGRRKSPMMYPGTHPGEECGLGRTTRGWTVRNRWWGTGLSRRRRNLKKEYDWSLINHVKSNIKHLLFMDNFNYVFVKTFSA